ncbi:class III signal peptide-containing protein [Pyrococcus horikoshii]|uniref:Class III signal peptide-containing protein n=1 Tax=Pyrococcus horikoshii TaxID=53953 RepID=A0A832T057_PYRHR|nr:class III signal peptide-containing protein [Pyrococcus horikoshii]HII61434.1 class III signal peptide-containing protein [Pyrococcus horikoshii]
MRKAQGAIEYLFMIAAALIIIAVVIKYLRGAGQSAGQQANSTISEAGKMISEAISKEIKNASG